jgi:hypothetical protein
MYGKTHGSRRTLGGPCFQDQLFVIMYAPILVRLSTISLRLITAAYQLTSLPERRYPCQFIPAKAVAMATSSRKVRTSDAQLTLRS